MNGKRCVTTPWWRRAAPGDPRCTLYKRRWFPDLSKRMSPHLWKAAPTWVHHPTVEKSLPSSRFSVTVVFPHAIFFSRFYFFFYKNCFFVLEKNLRIQKKCATRKKCFITNSLFFLGIRNYFWGSAFSLVRIEGRITSIFRVHRTTTTWYYQVLPGTTRYY